MRPDISEQSNIIFALVRWTDPKSGCGGSSYGTVVAALRRSLFFYAPWNVSLSTKQTSACVILFSHKDVSSWILISRFLPLKMMWVINLRMKLLRPRSEMDSRKDMS